MESKSLSKKGYKTAQPDTKKPAARKAKKPEYLKRKVQKKMAVSDPADSQEKEADKVAADVKQNLQRGTDEPAVAARSVSSSSPSISRTKKDEVQAKLFREEEEAQTKVHRQEEEVQTKVYREEEEEAAQPKLFRNVDELAQAKLFRQEDEEVAQTRLQRTEEEPVQTKLLRKELDDQKADDEKMDEVEARIAQTRGNGSPLPDEIRQKMEQQFGKDFSRVVIHTDMQSNELCKELNARAFAIGNDIYFASGEFNPESERGQELLAHELTHVVQQSQGINRKVYRAAATPARAATPSARATQKGATLAADGTLSHPSIGSMNRSTNNIVIPSIDLPSVKKPFTPQPCDIPRGRKRDNTQSTTWNNAIDTSSLDEKLQNFVKDAPEMEIDGTRAYYLKLKRENQFIMGTRDQILNQIKKPRWNKSGQFRTYDVDHKREFQLGGADGDIDNFWLLESSANRSSGAKINNEINRKLNSILDVGRYVWSASQVRQSTKSARSRDNIRIESHGADMQVKGHPNDSYEISDINGGEHLAGLMVLNDAQINTHNLKGSPTKLAIFSNKTGGRRADIPWGDGKTQVTLTSDPGWGFTGRDGEANIQLDQLTYDQQAGNERGTVSGLAYSKNKYIHGMPFTWKIVKIPGIEYGGAIDPPRGWVRNKLRAKGFSPVELTEEGLQGGIGLVAGGKIHCDIPILQGTEIGLNILGEDVEVDAIIPLENIKLPSPIAISHSSLRVFVGSRGLGAEGKIGLEVDKLGTGEFSASMSTDQKFQAEGKLTLDTSFFDRAEIDMWYRDGEVGGSGTVGIDSPNKIKGIRAANLTMEYNEGDFSATGTVDPDIPGIQQAGLTVDYTEEDGLTIGGDLQLTANPAIRSGSIHVEVNKQGEEWKVSGEGTAQPAIPGIDSELTVGYEDGGFIAEFSGGFERGMLSGNVTVGVSNRAVGEDGKPSGDPLPGGELLVYGSGSATIQIAPWLQGTAGVKFDPNGEVTVSGEIGIPDELEIFARKEINKSIFNVAVQVPIIPGIVAEVGGGLSAIAGIGPGVIDELKIGIEYNPAREQDTKVTGDAHLKVPADAGLRLSVRAGIGLGITGASATGGLDIGGTLGISGAAEAGVHMDWTPATGLDLTADLEIHAQPSFTFDIGGYVSVKVFGWSIYDDRFEFASYTFGSDYRFGIKLPVHYKEGEPFDISTDDIEFTIPDISTNDLLKGLISRIT
ncbi:eCIS core domain-containing protein [Thalassolituus maritimus]|uniref:eCIS core domain-containing protein n=1 Tax=Thalassolituus maritimus TaxID=484498 RepID=A0ABQ0A091_9GAMM